MKSKSSLRGVNIGGWLMMEGYLLHGRNIAESIFKKNFTLVNGNKALSDFEKYFRDNFITEIDFKNIASIGANVIRLPFNHKLVETSPHTFGQNGLNYLDNVFKWAQKYKLKIILDLHAAPGAQNCDWHGDSEGSALFWENANNRERAILLWEFLSDRYKNEESLWGYDVINEPVLEPIKQKLLIDFYKKAIKRIKAVDNRHVIYVEGSHWAQHIDFLADVIEENVSISIHYYHPLLYTFNFDPFNYFPGKVQGDMWNKNRVHKTLNQYYKFSENNKVKIFVGEFGINWRGGYFGETVWLDAVLKNFEDYGFDYTYWTYKSVATNVFPDGLYQHIPNNDFIRREGPLFGWENYIELWDKKSREIVDFWNSRHYRPNEKIINVLKKYYRKNV